MALLWMDGLDIYGGSVNNMLDGSWVDVGGESGSAGNELYLSTNRSRTGDYSIYYTNPLYYCNPMRRVLGELYTTVGVGFAFYPVTMPTVSDRFQIFGIRNQSNGNIISVTLQTTGDIKISYSGGSYTTTNAPLLAASWQHIEAKFVIDDVEGAIEIRVNGETIVNLSDIDTGSTPAAQVYFASKPTNPGASGNTCNYDDIFVWNDSGTTNNDFLGDRRVRTLLPNADTSINEWVETGAASGYEAIGELSPDDDTSYIEAGTTTPVTSEFELDDLPSGVGAIAAIQTQIRQRKTDAGDGKTQVSLISNGSVTSGSDRPITTEYTYWSDVFELDPDTGSAWNKDSVDAMKLRIQRTV